VEKNGCCIGSNLYGLIGTGSMLVGPFIIAFGLVFLFVGGFRFFGVVALRGDAVADFCCLPFCWCFCCAVGPVVLWYQTVSDLFGWCWWRWLC